MKFLLKPYRYCIFFSILLISISTFILVDTFIIKKPVSSVAFTSKSEETVSALITDNTYKDENMKISIETVRKYNSTIYIADIQINDPSLLKTALAANTFGRNIKESTSKIAETQNAIFAINGDYYGFRNNGYVVRNGTVYRATSRTTTSDEDLVIDKNSNFSIIFENKTALESLNSSDLYQVLSFGPALIIDSEISVDSSSEVAQSKNSNPRTAIGQVSSLHYIVIVSDGRTSESTGLSLLELASEFKERGCTTAYNLDGGGSSTMYFNGKVINNPTDGRSAGEREVSDIVYFGY